jgi:hypothetical protein
MLDLCAGLGGASQAMKARGWNVITLDFDPRFKTDVVADVREWDYRGERPDLIWASPPCDEFAREFMPWSKTGKAPALDLVEACKRIIDQSKPRYWVIENVKGAIRYFAPVIGNPAYQCNPYYLWGSFPDISHVRVTSRKEHLSSSAHAERAVIPYRISDALAYAIERQLVLFEA